MFSIRLVALGFLLLGFSLPVFAERIDDTDKHAWSQNGGWINFNPPTGSVDVSDTALTGYAWSDNYGWINLNPPSAGVINDGNGNLSGNAWGEQTGYIDFAGVTIGSDGVFSGNATNPVLGTISFNCANTNSCGDSNFKVRTFWRSNSSGAGGGSTVNDIVHVCDESGKCTSQFPTGDDEAYQAYKLCKQTRDGILCAQEWAVAKGYQLESDFVVQDDSEQDETLLSSAPKEETQEIPVSEEDSLFSDIAGHSYQQAVEWIAEMEFVQGYEDGTYRPDANINRVEFLKIILEATHQDASDICTHEFRYEDIAVRSWYANYVQKASCEDIVGGYPDGTFLPGNTINFVEAAKIIVKAFDLPHAALAEGESWYVPYVRALEELSAVPPSVMSYDQALTRGEMAQIVWYLSR